NALMLDHYKMVLAVLFLQHSGEERHLHSVPTRRSSDLIRLVPEEEKSNALTVIDKSQQVSAKYLSGMFLMIVCLWIMYGIGFTLDRKSTRLNSSHVKNSYAVFCLKKKKYHEP